MVTPVSNSSNLYVSAEHPASHQPASTKEQQPAHDSVQLSPQAKTAASADVDHDGDSH